MTFSNSGAPVYLRDLFDISRGYESPARYLNFYDWKDGEGNWQRTRAITLSVQMRSGEIIGEFGKAVDEALAGMSSQLPEDLTLAGRAISRDRSKRAWTSLWSACTRQSFWS